MKFRKEPLNLRLNSTGMIVYCLLLFVVSVASIFGFFLLYSTLRIGGMFVMVALQTLLINFAIYPFVEKRYGYKKK